MGMILHHAANFGVPRPPGNGTIVNYTSTVEGQLSSTSVTQGLVQWVR